LALGCSHPDYHLAGASLASLETARTPAALTRDNNGEQAWESEEASCCGYSVFRCR
jgi:hypothetical protein